MVATKPRPSPTPILTTVAMWVSDQSDRSNPAELDGATVEVTSALTLCKGVVAG